MADRMTDDIDRFALDLWMASPNDMPELKPEERRAWPHKRVKWMSDQIRDLIKRKAAQ